MTDILTTSAYLQLADESLPPGLAHQRIFICSAGQTIARVTAQPAGIPLAAFQLGRNAAWNAECTAIIATKAGHVVCRDNVLSIEETLELASDVDAAMPIDFPGNVLIRGNLLDQAKLSARGHITVEGAIEAADVTTAGNLVVNRGICAKERGRISAKGAVQARFLSNAAITAGGDISVQNEIGNSRLITSGQLAAGEASVLSSHITAVRGIACHTAGSTAGFRTILELGLDAPDLSQTKKVLADVSAERAKAQEIRSKVEPLLKNQKSLSPQQKEKATELLFLADEADAHAQSVAATLDPIRALLEAAMTAEIRIGGTLHAGVLLRCLGYETATAAAMRGPIRITLKVYAGGAHFSIADAQQRQVATIPAVATESCALARQLQQLKA